MPTKKGNSKYIETPEKLGEYFEQYKRWAKDNPETKEYFSPKSEQVVTVTLKIPLTWIGFEIWLRNNQIIAGGLGDYESNKDGRYAAYTTIIRAIKDEIYNQKYIGAAVGQFQHNIIARDLGLRDGQDHTSKGDKMEFPTEIKITRVEPKE